MPNKTQNMGTKISMTSSLGIIMLSLIKITIQSRSRTVKLLTIGTGLKVLYKTTLKCTVRLLFLLMKNLKTIIFNKVNKSSSTTGEMKTISKLLILMHQSLGTTWGLPYPDSRKNFRKSRMRSKARNSWKRCLKTFLRNRKKMKTYLTN